MSFEAIMIVLVIQDALGVLLASLSFCDISALTDEDLRDEDRGRH